MHVPLSCAQHKKIEGPQGGCAAGAVHGKGEAADPGTALQVPGAHHCLRRQWCPRGAPAAGAREGGLGAPLQGHCQGERARAGRRDVLPGRCGGGAPLRERELGLAEGPTLRPGGIPRWVRPAPDGATAPEGEGQMGVPSANYYAKSVNPRILDGIILLRKDIVEPITIIF